MSNPLFNALGGNQMQGPLGNLQNVLRQFNQFRSTFQGDPKQEVQKLLQSGRMSQSQLNQLQGMARQLQQFIK